MSQKPPVPTDLRAHMQKWWIDAKDRREEWFHRYFHTVVVTILIAMNVLFMGYSGLVIYLSRLMQHVGDPVFLLGKVFQPVPAVLAWLAEFFFIPFDSYNLWVFLFLSYIPVLTWAYSTNAQDIKKGYRNLISYRTERGRIWSFTLNLYPHITMFLAVFATYVHQVFWPMFHKYQLRPDEAQHIIVRNLDFLAYTLYYLPVFIVLLMTYQTIRDFVMTDDLRKAFFTWEFKPFAKHSFNLRSEKADVIVGWEHKTKQPIVLAETSRYLHELVVGPTGSGKTSTAIMVRVAQDLVRIAKGKRQGLVFLEPKGDAIADVLKLAEQLGIPKEKIKVVDPMNPGRSIKFNPFMGPMAEAAESFRGTLDALAGDQDEFFKGQQAETASSYVLLAKFCYRNTVTLDMIQRMYVDPRYLADMVEGLRAALIEEKDKPNPDLAEIAQGERLATYFESEVLEYETFKVDGQPLPALYPDGHVHAGKQKVSNKKDKFIAGSKKYLNDLALNNMLLSLMTIEEGDETLDADTFLEEGGVLLINTALGELQELSLMFGQFFIRQFQSAVFRRPNDERRIPTFFYVDEYPLYANEAFERLLTLGRSYKVGTLIALQSLGQLDKVIEGHKNVILTNASNKTVFGRSNYEDNEFFSKQFGEEYMVEESLNESTTPLAVEQQKQSWGYRYNTQRALAVRFTPTDIQELPFKHFISHIVKEDGSIGAPLHAIGKFVNETHILSRYYKLGELVLETQNSKPLDVRAAVSTYSSLVSAALVKTKEEVAGAMEQITRRNKPEEGAEKEKEASKKMSFSSRRLRSLTQPEVVEAVTEAITEDEETTQPTPSHKEEGQQASPVQPENKEEAGQQPPVPQTDNPAHEQHSPEQNGNVGEHELPPVIEDDDLFKYDTDELPPETEDIYAHIDEHGEDSDSGTAQASQGEADNANLEQPADLEEPDDEDDVEEDMDDYNDLPTENIDQVDFGDEDEDEGAGQPTQAPTGDAQPVPTYQHSYPSEAADKQLESLLDSVAQGIPIGSTQPEKPVSNPFARKQAPQQPPVRKNGTAEQAAKKRPSSQTIVPEETVVLDF